MTLTTLARTTAAAVATATLVGAPALLLAPTANATEYVNGFTSRTDCQDAVNAWKRAHPGAYAQCMEQGGHGGKWDMTYDLPTDAESAPTTWEEIGANFVRDFVTGFFDS
ncbi:hypothetical protein [Rhodococcus opacus]|uniref:Secreted protein n=1 Tax=Rhodococcus opacus TaxID=37919 RepID=A0A076F3N5_RHOOP|nr:hypothetical protein [Rhodococcus opacus]AII10399.1 hypothetical protein EP51_39535 [Rhodococcus opacus]